MKILYDHQIFQIQRFGGISRYFAEIIDHLPIQVQYEISIKYSNNEYIKEKNLVSDLEQPFNIRDKYCSGFEFFGKGILLNFYKRLMPEKIQEYTQINKQISIEKLKKQDFDLFHPTYYDDYFLEYLGNKPFVLTIHDMIHEIYPEFYPLDLDTIRIKKDLALRANHIIAVSENTKSDIIKILDIDPQKISVIYHSTTINEKRTECSMILPEKYILYVGERVRYKNFMFFIKEISTLLLRNKMLNLVCIGNSFSDYELDFFKSLGVSKQVILISAKEDEMYCIYNNAEMFIFPSYYEGFGIPILEAFSSGCPVILSKSSCFYEIANDSALYFEPKKGAELRDKIIILLNNKEIRSEQIGKANRRLECFSWLNSAKQTCQIYSKVLSSK